MTKRCFLFSLFLFSLSVLKAQDTTSNKGLKPAVKKTVSPVKGETYAIIVGVSNYPGIQPLKYADKDALLFRDFLQTPAGGNAKQENIFILINDSAKAANFNVKAYGWLKRKVKEKELKPGDRLYIYFSGHGDAMNEDNYFFLPYDCAPSKDDNNYLGTGNINMHSVKTLFIKPLTAKGVEVLLIVDACRTNELPGGEEGQKNFATYVQGIAEQKQGEIIMLSTGAGQVSVESPKIGNGHGLFTWYLIDGLSGMADKEGDAADNDGVVSFSEISSWVKNKVKKDAKQIFKTDQVPVFCCPEKDLATIAIVDSNTYNSWVSAKNLNKLTGDENLFAVAGKKPGTKGASENRDTALIALYNQFISAQKQGKLTGEQSAETFYTKMEKRWPGNDITEEARYSLASEFINFGQQKINLFLNGKGITYVQTLEEQYRKTNKDSSSLAKNDKNAEDSVKLPPGVAEQVTKMKALAITGFDVAADMTEKAIRLLKTDPELLEQVYGKYYFLKAQAINEKSNENITEFKDALKYGRMAINMDPSAAYNYYLVGDLLSSLGEDSCIGYFEKAIALAPRWAYPVNGLANFYSSKSNSAVALEYYQKAIALDSLYSAGWQNIGSIYHEMGEADSAKKYYYKALSINPCNAYANANLGRLYKDSIRRGDKIYAPLAISYLKKAIECDSLYGYAYFRMAYLYNTLFDSTGQKKYIDSSLFYLNRCIKKNPTFSPAYGAIGEIFLAYKKDTLKAKDWYVRAYNIDPLNLDNLKLFASFYDQIKDRRSLENIFKKATAARPLDPELFNTIGNYYQDYAGYNKVNDSMATIYYYNALRLNPSLSYINYNIGRIYRWLDPDSCIKFYKLAAFFDSTKYNFLYETVADLYKKKKNTDSAIYYYGLCLRVNVNPYKTGYFTEQIVEDLLIRSKFTQAEDVVKKYLFEEKNFSIHYLLMGSIRAASGRHKEAEICFIRSAKGFSEENAATYLNRKSFPYFLQSRLPDREGLLTELYSSMLVKTGIRDSLVQYTIDQKVNINSNYLFTYSHTFSLADLQVYQNVGIGEAPEFLLSAAMNASKNDSLNSYKWILRSFIDRFDISFHKYRRDSVIYKFQTLWPAAYKKYQKGFGFRKIQHENKQELLDNLMTASKKDTGNARLFTAMGDLNLLILKELVNLWNNNSEKIINRAEFEHRLDSAITANYKMAIRNYSKAASIDKKFEAVALCKMGDFYLLSGKTDDARKCYWKSIQSDTTFVYPYIKLGDYYSSVYGPPTFSDSALFYSKKAIDIDPLFQPFVDNLKRRMRFYEYNPVIIDTTVAPKVQMAQLYFSEAKTDSAKLYFTEAVNAFIKAPYFFYMDLFFIAIGLADSLNYPEECAAFFKAGMLAMPRDGLDIKKRLSYDIEFYWHYTRYFCKGNDTTQALTNMGQMLSAISERGDVAKARMIYDKLATDHYFAILRPLYGYKELMKRYPIKEPENSNNTR